MALKVASLNARGLRDASECTCLLNSRTFCLNIAAVQETHFTCKADFRVMEDDFIVFSAFGSRLSIGVSRLVGRSLDAIVNLVFAGDGGRLLVAGVVVKTFEFRIAAVHAPITAAERCPFFRRLVSFLDASKRTVLVGDWNAILYTKIDGTCRGASGSGRCVGRLVNFWAEFDLIDRYRLDQPGREMWTWIGSSSGQVRSYLDRVLVRRAYSDLVACPTFHWLEWTDHKLVRISLQLANRPSLAS